MAAPRTHAKPAFLTGRPRVQTQWVWGRYERRRWAIFGVKLALFLGLPWVQVDGRPALLFDLANSQAYVFGQVFWPQDLYVLGLGLAACAVLLFLTTTLVGRVFCGHACPHTLMTSLFMALDHLIEGDRPARLALDARGGLAPRRVAKHVAWVALAVGLGWTFAAYFGGPVWLAATVAGIVYLFAGHLRDFICTTTCPYGRFQGAMGDPDALVVAYDAARGEPRGKGPAVVARGGCVDCGLCVTACPMGIDIRKGLQYECITCARCVDACNATMARVGAAPDLIAFARANGRVENPDAAPGPLRQTRRWRPVAYALVLASLVGAVAFLVSTRPVLTLAAARDRRPALALADGRVANLYALKLHNKDTRPQRLAVALAGLDGQLVLGENPLTLAPGELREVKASVVLAASPGRPTPFRFRLVGASTGEAPATFVP